MTGWVGGLLDRWLAELLLRGLFRRSNSACSICRLSGYLACCALPPSNRAILKTPLSLGAGADDLSESEKLQPLLNIEKDPRVQRYNKLLQRRRNSAVGHRHARPC